MNDNKDTSNVDKSFLERLEVKRLAENINNMLDDIQAAAKLNGFDGPFVGESGDRIDDDEYYDLSGNFMFSDAAVPPDYFYSMFAAPVRPAPRLVSVNDTPMISSLKANLELIK